MLINRKLWITAYIGVWAVVVLSAVTGAPLWLFVTVSALALAFIALTDPEPLASVARTGCGCGPCDAMRARHARRNADETKTL